MCKSREGRADDQLHAAADGRRMARLGIGMGFIAYRLGFDVRGVSDNGRR